MSAAEAFAAIALAAVACDGAIDPREATLLRGQLEGLYPFRERSEESMGLLFEGLLDHLQAEGWRGLISVALPALNLPQQETALAVAAHLIHGDRRVSPEEGGLLAELAAQMPLPEGRAAQILEVITLLHRDSLAP